VTTPQRLPVPLALACAALAAPVQAEELVAVVKIPRLTLEAAEAIAQATIAACRKEGL
jgi:hypothetical protein